jgi:uncharacterized protein YjbJ (UPF0337 family)
MGSGSTDKAKGRVKEAGGALTGDRALKREGKVDRAGGGAKRGIDRVADGIRDLVGGRRRRERRREV